eukprot:COSAG02_NODE_2906_length_7773_cov_96.056555_3_plen_50_part_00
MTNNNSGVAVSLIGLSNKTEQQITVDLIAAHRAIIQIDADPWTSIYNQI